MHLFRPAAILAVVVLLHSKQLCAAEDGLEVVLKPPISKTFAAIHEWQGLLWIGTEAALYHCKLDGSDVHLNMESSRIRCFLGDEDVLWVGTDRGLFQTKAPSDTPTQIPVTESSVPILCIAKVRGELWLGTMQGLLRWRPEDNKPAANVFKPAWNVPVHCVAADSDSSNLWIGTGYGLYWLDTDAVVSGLKRLPIFENVSAISASGDLICYATGYPDGQGDPGAIGIFKTDTLRDNLVTVGSTSPVEAPVMPVKIPTSVGYARTIEMVGDRFWIGGEKGFYRFIQRTSGPEQTAVINQEVVGCHRNDDRVWVVTKAKIYLLEGFSGGEWTPTVSLIEKPSGSIFTNSRASLEWQVKELNHRTTPELALFEVVLFKEGHEFRRVFADRRQDPDGKLASNTFGISEVLPTGKYSYEIRAKDLNFKDGTADFESEGNVPEPFAVRSLASYQREIGLSVGVPLFVALILVGSSVPFQRFVVVRVFSWRYSLTPGTCSEKFEVEQTALRGRYRIAYISRPPARPFEELDLGEQWPPDTAWLAHKRQHVKGKNALVYVKNENYLYPFAHLIGGKWSALGEAAVAGQVISDLEVERPLLQTELCFAALGCTEAKGCTRLDGALPEATAVRKSFLETKAQVITSVKALGEATFEDFQSALQGADVVHVATHASPEEISLRDGPFTIRNIGELPEIRCRLLVLSACRAAEFAGRTESIAQKFVSRGVNVLASLQPIDDGFCEYFFPAFYKYWLPFELRSDMELGSAIRRAANDVARLPAEKKTVISRTRDLGTTMSSVESSLDTFVLFGDPSLQIRLEPQAGGEAIRAGSFLKMLLMTARTAPYPWRRLPNQRRQNRNL